MVVICAGVTVNYSRPGKLSVFKKKFKKNKKDTTPPKKKT